MRASNPFAFPLTAIALLVGGTLAAPYTLAQSDSGLMLEEVTVTARKKTESLQEVSVAVTAFSPEMIKNLGLVSVQDIQMMTPSLNIYPSEGASASPIIELRGQIQGDSTAVTLDPSVGIYFNGVYLGRAQGAMSEMFDIAGIEVLKGPQGILYGRNSTGGALKIETVKADPSAGLTGFVSTTAGNYDAQIVEGAINLPVTDSAAIRIAARNNQRDGWSDQVIMGPDGVVTDHVELNSIDSETYRISASWDATDSLYIEAGGDYWDANDVGTLLRQRGGDVWTGFEFIQYDNDRSVGVAYVPSDANASNEGYYLSLENEFESLTAKAILAHREWSFYQRFDLAATNLNIAFPELDQFGDQDSVELQLSGDALNQDLQWMVGLYYFKEEASDYTSALDVQGIDFADFVFDGTAESESQSIFGHLVYAINEQFSAQLGLRYTQDEKSILSSNIDGYAWFDGDGENLDKEAVTLNPLACPFGWETDTNTFTPKQGVKASATECEADLTEDYEYVSWTVGLDWFFSDKGMAYIKNSLGQRAGGQNIRGGGQVVLPIGGETVDSLAPFDPEEVLDTEVGIKYDTENGRGRINAAYFYTDYSEYQYSEIIGVSTFVYNLGDATIQGFEAEVSYLLLEGLMVSGFGSYLDFEYDEALFQQDAPKYKYGFTFSYSLLQSYGEWLFTTNYSYTDGVEVLNVDYVNDFVPTDGYELVNARAALMLDSGLSIAVFGRNLTDEKYMNAALGSTAADFGYGDVETLQVAADGEPRMYGVELYYEF
ncbi:TonB-dependent receptor [Oceanicoccus sagamiensis]|uniref:TonB-dependent receptor n=1 Tax=Oceanicoccus sagamiensis TaxID=716816 RepID=A0A1X9N4Q2_9GAMM|nr:TonB-dependent receptor [Oceanicoccus sagamiensis]ARN73100.1 hypothetical protein BST96_02650 [Oceanicoccus sagamiensis]